ADDQEGEDVMVKTWKTSKPADFQSLFGGNNNDHFMVGIKFTK
nr:U3 small nucleolar RNA-associated protein 25 [Tanacetum cinerariifolium]